MSAPVIIEARLELHEASQKTPESGTAVWLVLECPDGGLCWELGEWREAGIYPTGWFLVGTERPLSESDYQVRYWCDEPPLPPHPDSAPVADTGREARATP